MTTGDRLHQLIEELPQSELHAANRYLAYRRNMGDPVTQKLLEAPLDDEPSPVARDTYDLISGYTTDC
ncbi:MAG: hypothetical protein HY689_14095 [Chloroflexi bacterium]|nr:hypothetical protein [Chloroflexota bacterium]